MQIEIHNCNNIDSGIVEIKENRLNIKYAINGTGKSTISKAIHYSVLDSNGSTNNLSKLRPFKTIEDDAITPKVVGCESIASVRVFNENYLNEIVFQPDDLIKGSFDIFIRCENYDAGIREIESLVDQIKALLSEDQEIEDLINNLDELGKSFGQPTRSGIHKSSTIAKALKEGNRVDNIPKGLEIYKDYIQNANNFKWIKWQLDGFQFLDIADQCPYCVNEIAEKEEAITKVSKVYKPKDIEKLNKVVSVFKKLESYFSNDTRAIIEKFIKNVDGYKDDQVNYLLEIKGQVDCLKRKIIQIKNIGFNSLKDANQLVEHLNDYKIDLNFYTHFNSEIISNKVNQLNESIEELLRKTGNLQGKINIQKKMIEELVNKNKAAINDFLCTAGYKYEVDLAEDETGQYRLKLIHLDINNEVKNVKACLSYGERNAFALVLFMFDALDKKPDLVVLDDPISSFDKNKKYAMLDMLFRRDDSFRNQTVLLLSHDFEPIVDMVYHHRGRFKTPFATFLENTFGNLREIEIQKSDIQTFIEVNDANISNEENNLICRLVYLRRTFEITNTKGMAYQLISNILHKKSEPEILEIDPDTNAKLPRSMTQEEIDDATEEIRQKIPNFDYSQVLSSISDDLEMRRLYEQATSNYEKLHIYRIVFGDRADAVESDVIKKFINQAFHIENDYIYQLNPTMFQTVPQYVINECDNCFNN